MGAKGSTADQALGRQGKPGPESVLREGLNGVVGAARVEPARRDPPRRRTLVRLQRCGRPPVSAGFGDAPRLFMTIRLVWTRRPATGPPERSHELRRLAPCGRRLDPEQIGASGKGAGDAPRRLSHAAAQRVTDHGIATVFPNCVPHLGIHAVGSRDPPARRWRGPARNSPGHGNVAVGRMLPGFGFFQPSWGARAAQTVRRWRPLSRRDFKMARPARVDMRLRKPCVLARLRVFGW